MVRWESDRCSLSLFIYRKWGFVSESCDLASAIIATNMQREAVEKDLGNSMLLLCAVNATDSDP